VDQYEQTLPFYLRRTMTLVNYRGELDFGLKQEPHLIMNLDSFKREWRAQREALAVMSPSMFAQLQGNGLPMQEIGRDLRSIAVKKP
jgi:hypothetical protein